MDVRVHQVIAAMERTLHTPVRVDTLAAAAGLSVPDLMRLFRDATGTTPAAYLQALRMTRALALMERTTLALNEVMAQVGMTDHARFVREFRRAHGFPPEAYYLAVGDRTRAEERPPDAVVTLKPKPDRRSRSQR